MKIDLQGVSVTTVDRTILSELNLSFLPGITAIVGPSGSGKSTLLRLLNRLDVPTSGSILLDGTDLAELDPQSLRRRVAMVFQRPLVFPGTVIDNLTVAHPDLADTEAVAALNRVGLGEVRLDQDAESLSGGEAQRLALARVLLNDPEVLLADEVTSSLDREAAAAIDQLLLKLAAEGMTIVAVTHNAAQADAIATRIVTLVDGVAQ